MSNKAVADLLQAALELCAKSLDGQSDPALIHELRAVIGEIESAINLIERLGSAIPLGE